MKSNREGFNFDKNREINESKEALGLNKHVQKKFNSKREDAVEEVGKVVWYNASDFADAIRDRLENDEIAKHFDLIVAEEALKSNNGNHRIKIFIAISTDFYMPLGSVVFDYKKEKPMFYVVYSLGNITSFKGKKAIGTVKYKYSMREFSKYEANSEEVDLLVKDIDRILREKFPENDLFIGEKSKAIDESASLGLNKHVQKKFEHGAGEDAIDSLNELDEDTFAKMCIEEFSESPYIDHVEEGPSRFRQVILKTKQEYAVDVREGKSGLTRDIFIKIFTEEQKLYFRIKAFMYVFNNEGFVTSLENEGPEWREFSHTSIASIAEIKRAREELDKFFKKFTDIMSSISESSLGLNKHVQKKYSEKGANDTASEIGSLPLDVHSFEEFAIKYLDGAKIDYGMTIKYRATFEDEQAFKSVYPSGDVPLLDFSKKSGYVKVDRICFDIFDSDGEELTSSLNIYVDKEDNIFDLECLSLPGTEFAFKFFSMRSELSPRALEERIGSHIVKNVSESSLGLNKHVQKKFKDIDAVDNISDYVDLGLPSGTLWCKHNYGVEKEFEYGDLYSFEEAQSLGISLPTKEDFTELHKNCTHELTTVNDVHGMMFTSKFNGESVFFPAAGYKFFKSVSCRGSEGRYWSSEDRDCSPDGYGMVFDFYTQVNPSGTYLKTNAYSLREVQKPMRESSLGLNKHVQKKFNDSNPEGMAEEIGNLVYMSADDFFDGLQRQIDKDPVCKAFKLKVRDIKRKSDYQVNAILNNDEYEEIASIKVLEKSKIADNPLFLLTFNGKYPVRFEGKNPILSTLGTNTWWNTNAEETGALVEFLKEKMKKNFPSKVNETSLGLNKRVQKKFEEKDAIDNLELDYVDLGLPSGTRWCKHNYGAISEEEIGERHKFDEAQKLGVDVPSEKDFIELYNNCDYEAEYVNKIYGIRFTSKKNEKSIFLPVASSENKNVRGERYWSSTEFSSESGYNLSIDYVLMDPTNYNSKFFKYPVRPVWRDIKESSLGLNKRVQKKFNNDIEDKTVEIGSLPLSKEDFKEIVIEELNKEFDKIGHEHYSLKAWFRPSTWTKDEYVDIRYKDGNNYSAVARICIKNDVIKKEPSFFAVWQDFQNIVRMSSKDDPVDFINDTVIISSHDVTQFRLTHNSVNAFIDWLVNKSGFPLFNKEVNESSLGLNKHVQKKFEDKKSEDVTEDLDVISIDEFETKFIEEINSLEIRQAPLVKFHAVKRELDTIVIETTYLGKLSSASPSNGQLEFYVDEDDGSIVFSFWCCNSLPVGRGYRSGWLGQKSNGRKSKGNFYHKMCYKNLFKAISFARDFFTRHHEELYSDIDESSLGLNKRVQKKFEEKDPVDTEGLDIMKDPSAFMFAIQRYVQKKYSDVFTKFNLNDNIVKFKGELVDAKILNMYDSRFDPYNKFNPRVIITIDKKNLKFAVYVATENRGILYDDGSEWHDLSLSIMRESLEWAVKVFTGEIYESNLGLNKKVQKQYASKDIDNAIDMVSVSPLAVPVLFSDGHVDIKYLSCISTKEDSDDVIIKEKKSIIKRLVKHEGFTLLDGGKSVDDYVLTLTDERIRGQRHMYRFRFVMTPSMHDRGLCGVDQNDSEGGIAILPVDYIVKTHDDLEFSKLLLDKFEVSNPQFVYQGIATIYQDKDDGDKDIIIAQLDELKPRPSGKAYNSYYCTLRL